MMMMMMMCISHYTTDANDASGNFFAIYVFFKMDYHRCHSVSFQYISRKCQQTVMIPLSECSCRFAWSFFFYFKCFPAENENIFWMCAKKTASLSQLTIVYRSKSDDDRLQKMYKESKYKKSVAKLGFQSKLSCQAHWLDLIGAQHPVSIQTFHTFCKTLFTGR